METLVLRVLVALPGSAEGFKKEQILTFLDSSFGAFQLKQHLHGWKLNESQVLAAVDRLEGAELVERKANGGFIPTKLGRLVDIEAAMTQFGGGTNGAAGPVRSVASRTADLLETVVRTVEILHPAIELNDRPGRLH